MSRKPVEAIFWALSDPVRVEILDRLVDADGLTVSELATTLPLTRQAISRHLRTLESAALIAGDRSGRERRFHVDPTPLSAATQWIDRRARSWDATLERLDRHLDRRSGSSRQ